MKLFDLFCLAVIGLMAVYLVFQVPKGFAQIKARTEARP